MAISKIKVSTTELQSDARSVESSIKQLETEIGRLEQELNTINTMWEGPASETFFLVFQADIEELRNLIRDLQSFNTYENNAVSNYNRCESEVGGLVDSLNW